MPSRFFLLLLAAFAVARPSMGDPSTPPARTSSPFMAANGETSTLPDAAQNFELVGAIATTRHTLVGIVDRNTHKSFWIPVGKTSEGIEVVSYDQRQDRAVVKINGLLETLAMHAAGTSAPAPVASSPVAASTSAPVVASGPQVQQEQEARMLVSDLMDISIQQRKAYEESRRKATPSPEPK